VRVAARERLNIGGFAAPKVASVRLTAAAEPILEDRLAGFL
jgi:hypothetical protein